MNIKQTATKAQTQSDIAAHFPLTIPFPDTKPGELYLGVFFNRKLKKFCHTYLLPDELTGNWDDLMEQAANMGGDLPDRCELIMLFETMREQFKRDWYWSNTQHPAGSGYAYCQHFSGGDQSYSGKDCELFGRVVRRSVIQ